MGADPVADAFGRGLELPSAALCLPSIGATFCTSQPRALAPGACSVLGSAVEAAPAVCVTVCMTPWTPAVTELVSQMRAMPSAK